MTDTTLESESAKGGLGAGVVRASMLPFPVLCLNADGVIVETNGVLEAELGVRPGDLVGQHVREVVGEQGAALLEGAESPSDIEHVAQLSFRAAPGRSPRTFFFVQRDGERWLIGQPEAFDRQRNELARAHERAEAQNDEYARLSAELRRANADLDRRATQLEDATQAKARFLATMSHELRTPLNAVLGYAGLLRDGVYGTVSEQQERAVSSIVRRAKDLQLLIDDVLDLSKIESGRMELRIDDFDPAEVLNEVRDEMNALARAKELSVVLHYDLRRNVRTDRAKYKHVLLNLVSNAVKFTPERGAIELSLQSGAHDTFVTRVRDTGIGIAPEHLKAIFHTFQQIDSGTTRRFGGIGLGLSLARRTVEHMGGEIDVESVPGRGTAFTISLPVRPPQDALVNVVETAPDETDTTEPVVLAIDDDPEVIGLLRDSLAPARFRVVGALNGDRGLELARIVKPFAITLDIMMPEKDGWQVLREIKSDPSICDIPVIIMSIVSEEALGFSLGVTEYLVKPVDRRVLINVLERLRKRQASLTAIVIDDDFDARILLRDLLQSLGFRVRTSDSAATAQRLLDEEVPDVLFVDLTMPEAEVSSLLRSVSAERRFEAMRIVAVTRSDMETGDSDWLKRAAAQVVFTDRPQPEELMRELRRALSTIGSELDPAVQPRG